jgi:hypothetical protein
LTLKRFLVEHFLSIRFEILRYPVTLEIIGFEA